MEYSDLKYLLVDLPGDIRRLKDAGDFTRMKRVINMRLNDEKTPLPMRRRLELELAMDEMLDSVYPYEQAQAEQIMNDTIVDFRPEELEYYRDIDAADWIYVDGKVRFRRNFMNNLIKTRSNIYARVRNKERLANDAKEAAMLDGTIMKMIEKGEVAYRFRIRATVQIKPEVYRPGKVVRVHIPVPIEYSQMEQVRIISCSPEPKHIAAPDYPQRTVCFEGVYPQETVFTVEYEYVNHVRYVKPDPSKVLPTQPRFYTEELEPHIVFKPYLKELCASIIGNETNPLVKARLIYDWITTKPIYSFMPPYFVIEDLCGMMATRLKGDCGIFALLFITLCRIAGVPARWQSGLETSPMGIGMHDWCQFYVAPYGWLYADCSFGNSAVRNGNDMRREFYFGNLDPFRMCAASEFQHDFDPPMKHMRYDPYDNQDGEAEYEDCRLLNSQIFTDQEMIEWEEL